MAISAPDGIHNVDVLNRMHIITHLVGRCLLLECAPIALIPDFGDDDRKAENNGFRVDAAIAVQGVVTILELLQAFRHTRLIDCGLHLPDVGTARARSREFGNRRFQRAETPSGLAGWSVRTRSRSRCEENDRLATDGAAPNGLPLTNVPRPTSRMMMPSCSRLSSVFRTVLRAAMKRDAISRSVGSLSPGFKVCFEIPASMK
jgi:hypothetical protein